MFKQNKCLKKDASVKQEKHVKSVIVSIEKKKKNWWDPIQVETIKGQTITHIDEEAFNEFLGVLLFDALFFDDKQLKYLLNMILVGIAGKKKGRLPSVDDCHVIDFVADGIFKDAQRCFRE